MDYSGSPTHSAGSAAALQNRPREAPFYLPVGKRQEWLDGYEHGLKVKASIETNRTANRNS